MVKKLRIREAFDSSVPSWLRPALSTVAKIKPRYDTMSKINTTIDLNTAKFVPSSVPVNARDPKWSDEIIIPVFHGNDVLGNEFTWIMGYNDPEICIDPKELWKTKPISRVAKSKVIDMSVDFGYFIKGDGIENAVAKRKSRTDSRFGSLDRDLSKAQTKGHFGNWYTAQGYDKSGYKLNKDKYKDMLAQLDLERYETILDDAVDAMSALGGMYRQVRNTYTDSEDKRLVYDILDSISSKLNRGFADVDRAYLEWQNSISAGQESRFTKMNILDCIKKLRASNKKAQSFISGVNNGMEARDLYDKYRF